MRKRYSIIQSSSETNLLVRKFRKSLKTGDVKLERKLDLERSSGQVRYIYSN